MGSVMRKMESVNAGNRLTVWTVLDYGATKIVVPTAFVTDKLDDVNVVKNGPVKIVKKQFVNPIIAITMESAT